MSCGKAQKEHADALSAHAAAVNDLRRFEDAIFGSQSPPPILLSDADLETLRRLEADEQRAERVLTEKAAALEEAKRHH